MEIPVYVFTGFLEAGKTSFLQGTLEDERFNDGESTLVLMCEEGEVELEPAKFSAPNVQIETVEDPDDLTPFTLQSMWERCSAERVIVEYNGMWPIGLLLEAMPEEWVIYQQYSFFDATTFVNYNANMRQQTVDKITNTDMVVFNRADGADQEEFHKIIRGLNRRCDILFEMRDGTVVPDKREDPLPFDVNAPVIEVEDKDYAIWYREVSEEPEKYDGKTFKVKGMIVRSPEIPENSFICGRQVMTCCVEDIQFAGFMCNYEKANRLQHQSWAYVTAEMKFMYHPVYQQKGPVLFVKEVALTAEPSEPVATFY